MRMKKILSLVLAQMAVASQTNDVFYTRRYTKRPSDNQNPIKTNRQKRELREFRVKGEVIMAYSKKDAIKRLNHQKRSFKRR